MSGQHRNLFCVHTQTKSQGKGVFVKYPKVQLLVIAHVRTFISDFQPLAMNMFGVSMHLASIRGSGKKQNNGAWSQVRIERFPYLK